MLVLILPPGLPLAAALVAYRLAVAAAVSGAFSHATAHFHESAHPIIRSFEPGRTGAGATGTRHLSSASR